MLGGLLARRWLFRLMLKLLMLRSTRIGLAAGAVAANIDVEPIDTNVLLRQSIAQRFSELDVVIREVVSRQLGFLMFQI